MGVKSKMKKVILPEKNDLFEEWLDDDSDLDEEDIELIRTSTDKKIKKLLDLLDKIEDEMQECNHKWKTYNGFTDKYDYCELCNVKKN